jgi:hypothetical protein
MWLCCGSSNARTRAAFPLAPSFLQEIERLVETGRAVTIMKGILVVLRPSNEDRSA